MALLQNKQSCSFILCNICNKIILPVVATTDYYFVTMRVLFSFHTMLFFHLTTYCAGSLYLQASQSRHETYSERRELGKDKTNKGSKQKRVDSESEFDLDLVIESVLAFTPDCDDDVIVVNSDDSAPTRGHIFLFSDGKNDETAEIESILPAHKVSSPSEHGVGDANEASSLAKEEKTGQLYYSALLDQPSQKVKISGSSFHCTYHLSTLLVVGIWLLL